MADDGFATVTCFQSCYLLSSLSSSRCYVGYTNNPERRLREHNSGARGGARNGAAATASGGPWDMVTVVHGFISPSQAQQFEWAWQHPRLSRGLRLHAAACCSHAQWTALRKHPVGEQALVITLQQMAGLLSIPPWRHCPLTVSVTIGKTRWNEVTGGAGLVLPETVRVNFRPVCSVKNESGVYDHGYWELAHGVPSNPTCTMCGTGVFGTERRGSQCAICETIFHLRCAAGSPLAQPMSPGLPGPSFIPRSLECPGCGSMTPWSEVVRFAWVLRTVLGPEKTDRLQHQGT